MSLRILIVEDQKIMVAMLNRVIDPIREKWPDCTVETVGTWADAKIIAETHPPPAVILLDLSLPDSTREKTVDNLSILTDRSAVVIITGHRREDVGNIGNTPYIYKPELSVNALIAATVAAISFFQKAGWDRAERNLQRMKEIVSDAA